MSQSEEGESDLGWIYIGGGVSKRVTTPGSGTRPTTNAMVQIHYVARVAGGDEFDSSRTRSTTPLQLELGSPAVVDGVTIGLLTMYVGELATLRIPASAGFGSEGVRAPNGAYIVPPGADLEFDIELVGIVDAGAAATARSGPTNAASAEDDDTLRDAEALKEQGNARLASGDASAARYKYLVALQMLAALPPPSQTDPVDIAARQTREVALAVALHSNVAKACLDLSLYSDAAEAAARAIKLSPAHEKALYRRAIALERIGLLCEAEEALTALLRAHPSNAAGVAMRVRLQRLTAKVEDVDAPALSGGASATTIPPGADTPVGGGTGLLDASLKKARPFGDSGGESDDGSEGTEEDGFTAARGDGATTESLHRRRGGGGSGSRGGGAFASALARGLASGGLYADAPGYDKPVETVVQRGGGRGWVERLLDFACGCCRRRRS